MLRGAYLGGLEWHHNICSPAPDGIVPNGPGGIVNFVYTIRRSRIFFNLPDDAARVRDAHLNDRERVRNAAPPEPEIHVIARR